MIIWHWTQRDVGTARDFLRTILLPLRSVLRNPMGADAAEFVRGTLGEDDPRHHDDGDARHADTKPQHFQQTTPNFTGANGC